MAVRFDNVTDRLLRTSGVLNYNADYTVAFWFYLVAVNAGDYALPVSIGAGNDDNIDCLEFATNSSSIEIYAANQLGSNSTSGSYALSTTTWYHIVLSRSGNSVRMVINGVERGSVNVSPTSRTASTRFEFGAAHPFDAYLCNSRVAYIKVWEAALTDAEIAQEMYLARPQRIANLHGWWPTLAGTQRTTDYSGQGRDFTAGGTLTDEDSPGVSWGAVQGLEAIRVTSGGSVTVTPAAASAAASRVSPAVVLSGVTIGPAAVSSAASRVNPTVVLGSVTVAPAAATSAVSRLNPTVDLSAVTVDPSAATSTTAHVVPTVMLGDISVSPASANASTAAPSPNLIAGFAAQWSLRLVNPDWAGPLGRARRSSDSAELDFGGDVDGLLDTTAMATWAGGADLQFAWYDQSGHGHHQTATDPASWPILRLDEGIGGKPVLVYTGGQYLDASLSTPIDGDEIALAFVGQMDAGTSQYGSLVSAWSSAQTDDYNNAASARLLCRYDVNEALASFRENAVLSNVSVTHGVPVQVTAVWDGTNHTLYVDGVAGAPVSSTGTFGVDRVRVGNSQVGGGLGSDWMHGRVFEIVLMRGAPSETDREALETDQTAYWLTEDAGGIEVTPDPAEAGASVVDPVIGLGDVVVTPAVASAGGSHINPTISLGDLVVTPAAVSSAVSRTNPTVSLSGVTVAPSAATSAVSGLAPVLILGSVTVTLVSAASVGGVGAPTVRLGAITVAPTSAASVAGIGPIEVLADGVIVAPTAATSVAGVAQPILIDAVTFTPAAATSTASVSAPTMALSGLVITVSAASSVTSFSAPTLIDAVVVEPEAATATADIVEPTILAGGITVLVNEASTGTGVLTPSLFFGSVLVSPASAAVKTTAAGPILNYGDQTVTPDSASASAQRVNPTVVFGSLTLVPTAATSSAQVSGPVFDGTISVAVGAATAKTTVTTPSVIHGDITPTLGVASTKADRIAPTVVLGSIQYTPSIASAAARAVNPLTSLDGLIIVPTSADAATSSSNPTSTYGSIVMVPAGALAKSAVGAPQIGLGNVLVELGTVAAGTAIANPTVDASTQLSLDAATTKADRGVPAVVLGALTIAVSPAGVRTVVLQPQTHLDGLSITPVTAGTRGQVIAPSIVQDSISVALGMASSHTGVIDPTSSLGLLILSPSAAGARGQIAQPMLALGSLTIAPTPVWSRVDLTAPTLLDAVVITPTPASARTSTLVVLDVPEIGQRIVLRVRLPQPFRVTLPSAFRVRL